MSTSPSMVASGPGRIAYRPSQWPARCSRSELPRNRARFWQPEVPLGAGVVCADIALDAVRAHVHEGLLVVVALAPILAGDGSGPESRVEPGTVHVVPPLAPVTLRRVGPLAASVRLLLITPRRADGQPRADQGTSNPVSHASVRDAALHGALVTLLHELRRPLADASLDRRLIELIGAVRAEAQLDRNAMLPAHRIPGGVLRVRALLRQDATRPVSLEELADVAALSKCYLLRAFQRAHGLTPHGYQMQLRLARARRLIEAGRPLSFAAYDAAFADQSHLTRRFRDYFGLTPAVYGRQVTRFPAADETPFAADAARSAA
jgi:AraC-like DNA-binding protein